MLFVNIRVRKITPLFGLKLQNFGPFNAGPFNAAPQKLTPIRAGVKRANNNGILPVCSSVLVKYRPRSHSAARREAEGCTWTEGGISPVPMNKQAVSRLLHGPPVKKTIIIYSHNHIM